MNKFVVQFLLLLNLVMILLFPNALSESGYGGDETGGVIIFGFNVYKDSCPEAEAIVFSSVQEAVMEDPRMAASLLRLHFHDCFVNGCDGSVLLDDTDNFVGEKTAPPNLNSLRGFEVIEGIKSELEAFCPETISCADILAIAARDSVLLSGGPSWEVQVGRKDSLTASKTLASNNIPGPNSTVSLLLSKFQNVGLDLKDMVALSGAHTMGKARCSSFSGRLQNSGDPNNPLASSAFIQSLQQLCSGSGGGGSGAALAQLDLVTPATFDNQYYVNLISGEGLLPSDQVLVTGDDQTRELVETYAQDTFAFFEDFQASMLRMGGLGVKTGASGEIRRNCRTVN
ncbi:Peroxidase [Parasponia andersonii]|uniref:Peroxidase n=1 Tax=Parasponia andersonii TaxID=3476 RepID=A0A2P5CVB3_PARAD|nr:Peroxidase [Parasponia andersonii]